MYRRIKVFKVLMLIIILFGFRIDSYGQLDKLVKDGLVLAYHYQQENYEEIERYISSNDYMPMPDSKSSFMMYHKTLDRENSIILIVDKRGRIGLTKVSESGSFYIEKVERDIAKIPIIHKSKSDEISMYMLTIPRLQQKEEGDKYDYMSAIEITPDIIWFYKPDRVNEDFNWSKIIEENL